ncbi:hypothetical protein [Williamsia herbipolensis]|uniref:hypothetical protein n=1 Tax=Williamsia herbipolensis TaxID=1603258 RepID=UPI0005F81E78|nr:hypothetical protein [Williamsia herbipolensis]
MQIGTAATGTGVLPRGTRRPIVATFYVMVVLAVLATIRLCCCVDGTSAQQPEGAVALAASHQAESAATAVPSVRRAHHDTASAPTAHCSNHSTVDLAIPTGAAVDHHDPAVLATRALPADEVTPRSSGRTGSSRSPPTTSVTILHDKGVLQI